MCIIAKVTIIDLTPTNCQRNKDGYLNGVYATQLVMEEVLHQSMIGYVSFKTYLLKDNCRDRICRILRVMCILVSNCLAIDVRTLDEIGHIIVLARF
jgi:hypothetical protein